MRDLRELNRYRDWRAEAAIYGLPSEEAQQAAGVFQLPVKSSKRPLRVIASTGMGWDHVSVSLPARCPSWEEMELVKRVFFLPGEVAMQLHVGEDNHISNHAYCLHIWRPNEGPAIPLPPSIMVGLQELGELPVRAA